MNALRNIPAESMGELRRLNTEASGLSGGVPLDDPRRDAAEELCHYVAHLVDAYGVSVYDLSAYLGLNRNTLRHRLISRGLTTSESKSIKPHKNAVTDRTGYRKPHCIRGHERTAGNVDTQGHCRQCRRESRSKARDRSAA